MKTITSFLLSILLSYNLTNGFLVPVQRTVPTKNTLPTAILASTEDSESSRDGKLSRFKSLLGRLNGNKRTLLTQESEQEETVETSALEEPPEESKPDAATLRLDPMEQAKRLRSAAEKARLEAERMDAALTLEKIARLERELTKPKADVETLQRELTALQRKLTIAANTSNKSDALTAVTSEQPKEETDGALGSAAGDFSTTELSKIAEPLNEGELREQIQQLEEAPKFLLASLAIATGEIPDDEGSFNVTKLALKLDQIKRYDFSNSPKPAPVFTSEQIKAKEQEIEKNFFSFLTTGSLKAKVGNNSTKLALLLLESNYYTKDTIDISAIEQRIDTTFEKWSQNNEWLQQFNKTTIEYGIESLYPACTRRSEIPTEAVMDRFMKQVLPKTNFVPSGNYQKTVNGYIVRGTVEGNDANLVESIDRALGPLAENMTVLYTPDFTVYFVEEDSLDDPLFDPLSEPPILYIVGPEITRESKPIQLGITSALGLATSWYLSIYPFLLNSGIAKRVDEDLALVDAGLQPDLVWLTDLSVPLFASFMGILLAHEMGHVVAAGIHKFRTSVPTFVPSFITGVTSTVTTFKTLPPTRIAVFDFSLAGPALGMLASIAALFVGSQLTVTGDPTNFPALPLAILRQSTLGGGIIDYILGGGTLYVPDAALGTNAVAEMTIPLHPIALAGYIGLIVNALSLLPIGTTDGGRIAQTLFGRPSKLPLGSFSMLALLVAGVLGSDLFLFYFAFCLAFQSGNEVPARNEVVKVDLTRVFLAIVVYMPVLLTLIPFQI